MSNELSILFAPHAPDNLNKRKKILRPIVAALLSVLHPGIGQALNRQWPKASVFAILPPVAAFLAGLIHLLHTLPGFLFWILVTISLLIVAAVDAFKVARRPPSQAPSKARRELVWLFFLILTLNVAGQSVDFYFDHLLGVRANVNRSDSMAPTLRDGDRVVSDMKYYRSHRPHRGDLVVFDNTKVPSTDGKLPRWIKRVIAVGGDTLEIRANQVIVNGQEVEELYLLPLDSSAEKDNFGPARIPQDQVFLMGDNRANSYDSRYWGPLPTGNLRGRVLYVYWSPDRSRIGKRFD